MPYNLARIKLLQLNSMLYEYYIYYANYKKAWNRVITIESIIANGFFDPYLTVI